MPLPLDNHTLLSVLKERLELDSITAARMRAVSRSTQRAISAKTPTFYDFLRRCLDIIDNIPNAVINVKFSLKSPLVNGYLTLTIARTSTGVRLSLPSDQTDEIAKIMAYNKYTDEPGMFDAQPSWLDFGYAYDIKYNADYIKITDVHLLADVDKMNELMAYVFTKYVDKSKEPVFADGKRGSRVIPEYQWMHDPKMKAKLLDLMAKASLYTPVAATKPATKPTTIRKTPAAKPATKPTTTKTRASPAAAKPAAKASKTQKK